MYELVFWNYKEGVYLNNHLVYEAIVAKEMVEGLEALSVAIILNRIQKIFENWERIDDKSWKNTNGKGAFCVQTTAQSIKIDCYGTEGKTMNQLVNIMSEFKCVLYDPQIPERNDEISD